MGYTGLMDMLLIEIESLLVYCFAPFMQNIQSLNLAEQFKIEWTSCSNQQMSIELDTSW